jgi:small-conductance mechanosensitive channel
MKKFFGGGKSVGGAIIAGAGAIAAYLGYPDVGALVASLGATLFGVGIAHKLQKGNDNK